MPWLYKIGHDPFPHGWQKIQCYNQQQQILIGHNPNPKYNKDVTHPKEYNGPSCSSLYEYAYQQHLLVGVYPGYDKKPHKYESNNIYWK